MRRTKIFYFIPNLEQGGPERQLLELIRRLPSRFEPQLCLYHDRIFFHREVPEGQPRYVLGHPQMNLDGLKRLTELLRKEQPQILHSFRDKSNFWARIAAKRAGVPVIISSCRNRMMELKHLLVERFLSNRCHLVLTNSVGVKHELTRWARVDSRRIRIIHNIIDVDFFRLPSERERQTARERFNLLPGQRTLVLPGRIGLQKHQLGLLVALRRLYQRGELVENIVVLLAGRKRDLNVSRLVQYIGDQPPLDKLVRFIGPQSDMRSVYWASDLLVMPSLFEGLANAALEGCACGLPAILSHAANVDHIVLHGETGIEVPTGYWIPLADALREMLSYPETQLRTIGRASRAHIKQRFAPTPDYVVKSLVKVYDELLATHGGSPIVRGWKALLRTVPAPQLSF